MRNVISFVVTLVAPYTKAVVAFVVSSIVAYAAQRGIVIDDVTSNALVAGFGGLITAVCVFLAKNR